MPSFLDPQTVAVLLDELRRSMRGLLRDLRRDLASYSSTVTEFHLPLEYWRLVEQRLPGEAYSNWKAVGWIESLNDLLFFIDVRAQFNAERDRRGFADSLFEDCRTRFYENSYLDELFPSGAAQAGGLDRRLTLLCGRLARAAIQESISLIPDLACEWVANQKRRTWDVSWEGGADFEQAIAAGTIAVGCEGAGLRAASSRLLQGATLHISADGLAVKRGRKTSLLISKGELVDRDWRYQAEQWIRPGLTLGPTLVYGKDRTPIRVDPTQPGIGTKIRRALHVIEEAWPEGAELLGLLTSRIVPLKARGVVSFSYRHRPGLSFINVFDRTPLDLIDDLIHENSHHHLNLLLRKHRFLNGDHTDEIFYSPWRRSLRPIRGILHATFTFTMGAMLFERLSSWKAIGNGREARGETGLTEEELLRARFRCMEEVASVHYSLRDLAHARTLGWLSGSGGKLVSQLEKTIGKVEQNLAPYKRVVQHSQFGPVLRRHIDELRTARQAYGSVKLSTI